ncbi:hypothetical protein B296_00020375 [Ensete ventricosum]|uniref:Uncharacterized protein n=1 Tax=Ensete ventricosum TaxID=4639 RepID=A0A427AUZ1_ENSVE|nr:hypothetical protein B296_00020375 [Ensete ventricosum]
MTRIAREGRKSTTSATITARRTTGKRETVGFGGWRRDRGFRYGDKGKGKLWRGLQRAGPVHTNAPAIVSVQSWSSVGWVEPQGPAREVDCWNDGARAERKYSSSSWPPTPARRSGPSDGQVSSVVDFTIPPLRGGAWAFIVTVTRYPYLNPLSSLLLTVPLLLTMPSVGHMTADPSMPMSDRLPRVGSTTSVGQLSEGART